MSDKAKEQKELETAKAQAKEQEKEKIRKKKAEQTTLPGTDQAGDGEVIVKRKRGRPPGSGKKESTPAGIAPPAPRKKRKPIEEIADTDDALRRWHEDGKKLVNLHLAKYPNAKVAAIDPFTAKRESLKLDESECVGLCHFTFNTLGGFMRVPSLVPSEEKLTYMGTTWARALPYMNIDPGKFYVAIAVALTGSVVISMAVASVLRLLGKWKDPMIDGGESQLAPQLAALDSDGLSMVERQVEMQIRAERDAIARRREQLDRLKKDVDPFNVAGDDSYPEAAAIAGGPAQAAQAAQAAPPAERKAAQAPKPAAKRGRPSKAAQAAKRGKR